MRRHRRKGGGGPFSCLRGAYSQDSRGKGASSHASCDLIYQGSGTAGYDHHRSVGRSVVPTPPEWCWWCAIESAFGTDSRWGAQLAELQKRERGGNFGIAIRISTHPENPRPYLFLSGGRGEARSRRGRKRPRCPPPSRGTGCGRRTPRGFRASALTLLPGWPPRAGASRPSGRACP